MFKMASSVFFSALRNPITSGCNLLRYSVRPFSITPSNRLKEIVMTKTAKETIFEGKIYSAPWEPYLVKSHSSDACPLCATNLDVKHTDVLILSQFVRSDGCMLPRRITGLCKTQQKRVSKMVAMAQKAGLMSAIGPSNSKRDPKQRKEWKKFNQYFDESTITLPREYRKKDPQLFTYV